MARWRSCSAPCSSCPRCGLAGESTGRSAGPISSAFLAVTARVLVPLLLLVQAPFRGAEAMGELANSMIPVGQTLGWVVNLIVVETVIRRRRADYAGPFGAPAGRS